jgi:hypothetical protein
MKKLVILTILLLMSSVALAVYTASIAISMGASKAGLTLNAKLIDTDGNQVGATRTEGFVDLDKGNYGMTDPNLPAGFRGFLLVYDAGDPNVNAICPLNPEQIENTDVKISGVDSNANAAKLAAQGADANASAAKVAALDANANVAAAVSAALDANTNASAAAVAAGAADANAIAAKVAAQGADSNAQAAKVAALDANANVAAAVSAALDANTNASAATAAALDANTNASAAAVAAGAADANAIAAKVAAQDANTNVGIVQAAIDALEEAVERTGRRATH